MKRAEVLESLRHTRDAHSSRIGEAKGMLMEVRSWASLTIEDWEGDECLLAGEEDRGHLEIVCDKLQQAAQLVEEAVDSMADLELKE